MDVPRDLRGGEVECPGCAKSFRPEPSPESRDDGPMPVVHSSRRRRRRRRDYDDDFEDFDRPSPERRTKMALARLKPAAICLIVIAILRLLFNGLFASIFGFGVFQNANPGMLVFLAVGVLMFALCSLQAYGAWLMLNARSYGLGLTAGILLLIPGCDYCFWPFYLGFAIWAIVIINDADVRWLIRQRQKQEHEMERRDD
jgi:hypothetical protein